jgi:serine/threonine protein kinase
VPGFVADDTSVNRQVGAGSSLPVGGGTSVTLAPAMRLPDFDTLPVLGRGAATTVYRLRLGDTDYALKVFNHVADGGADTGRALAGFRREAAIMASIDHPGLPRIYEVGQARGARTW